MKILITGGAGFIGCNVADSYLQDGHSVCVVDTLQRKGSAANLAWLQERHTPRFAQIDLRDYEALRQAIARFEPDVVLHLAGQVAVTSSVNDPRADFEANALGTLNMLESLRTLGATCPLLYSSTNKVYGGMEGVETDEEEKRYVYVKRTEGISETMRLDFHSPYGCSKGAADQYVRDYHRIFGIPTVVLRQSCIYGERQFGVEDQGWLAWLTIATVLGKPITIYGNGKQVRDVLHVDDLVSLYKRIVERIDVTAGRIYNCGGGPANTLSLLESIELLSRLLGKEIKPLFADWRPGDQKIYISDTRCIEHDLEWSPTVNPASGVERLYAWVSENEEILRKFVS